MAWVPFREKYEVCEDGRIRVKETGLELATYELGGMPGKRYVGTTIKKAQYVHRIVCEAFYGPPPQPKITVEHKDGNRKNNHKDNLCWMSHSDNNRRRGVQRAPKKGNTNTKQHYISHDSYVKKDGKKSDYYYVRIEKFDLTHNSSHKTLEEAIKKRDELLDEYERKRAGASSSQTPAE